MSITERMSAIHIDPAASNNRGDGSSAGTAWRDCGELVRRLGRGTAWFRQPTTVTLHGSLLSGDYLNLQAAVGVSGNLKVVGVRTSVLTGTFSAKTDFATGSQAQQVTGTGLGSHAGKQIEITASGTSSHVGAIARIAKSVSGDNVRTTPFAVPKTNGTLQTIGVGAAILPSVGDSFAVYSLPTLPVGKVAIVPASNVNSDTSGADVAHALFQHCALQGNAGGVNYGSSLTSEAWRSGFVGCDLNFLGIVGHESESALQACKLDAAWFSGGASIHFFSLQSDSTVWGTQIIGAHYMDIQHILGQGIGPSTNGVLPFSYAGCTLIMNHAEAYDSAASGLLVRHNSHTWSELNIWGSGNAQYGVQIASGARLFSSSTGAKALTGALGDIQLLSPDTSGGSTVHTWSEGDFTDVYGGGVTRRG